MPKTAEEFFVSFDSGRVNGQKVFSFFGVLRELAHEHTGIPLPDSKTMELPKEIMLTDPFGTDQRGYWITRQRAYATLEKGEVSLQAFISGRTLLATNNLTELALSTHDEELKEAAEHIVFWLEGERVQIDGLSNDVFETYVAGMHFAYGDPDVLLTLLNSLETVKQRAPELFVRLCGRALRPLSPEDARSDLFGNLLHAALYRSLHMETGKGTEGYQVLQKFLAGLTHMDTHQEMIAPLSEEEIQAIGEVIEKDVQSGSFMAVAMAPMIFKEGHDAYMLVKLLERVSAENREGLLQELRTVTPNEFVRLMRGRRLLPKELEWYENPANPLPPDVLQILRERGFPEVASDTAQKTDFIHALYAGGLINTVGRTAGEYAFLPFRAVGGALSEILTQLGNPSIGGLGLSIITPFIGAYAGASDGLDLLKNRNKFIAEHTAQREVTLWKTTPSEKLLKGREFFDHLIDVSMRLGRNEKKSRLNTSDQAKSFARCVELLNILNAHGDIIEEQWFKYIVDMTENKIVLAAAFQYVLAPIFRNTSVEGLLGFSSQFFRMYQTISGCEGAVQNYRPEYSVEANLGELITSLNGLSFFEFLTTLEQPKAHHKISNTVEGQTLQTLQDVRVSNRELNSHENEVLKNLHILTRLLDPIKLAEHLDLFFASNPGAFELFCEMLSREDREAFLKRMCVGELSALHEQEKKIKSNPMGAHGRYKGREIWSTPLGVFCTAV